VLDLAETAAAAIDFAFGLSGIKKIGERVEKRAIADRARAHRSSSALVQPPLEKAVTIT
jgi:hypothetical protein